MNDTFSIENLSKMSKPNWDTRKWNRPTIQMTTSNLNPNLIGIAEFNYQGLQIRGLRIYNCNDGTLRVAMPQKRFGEGMAMVTYFKNPADQTLLYQDVAWLWLAIFGTKLNSNNNS